MGAWIEIDLGYDDTGYNLAAPFVGAWIEILTSGSFLASDIAAPFVGAWIEIVYPSFGYFSSPSRTLRGCVD